MRKLSLKILAVLLATSLQGTADSPDPPQKVFVFEMKEMIAPPMWHKTKKAFEKAREADADLILIHMNTYGGMLESADSIRTIILQSAIPVWVFIDNNAASAGALISIACDSIYMRPGANIGAATVVDQEGKKMPDKYQSYMRAMMRSTAEAKGRNPMIAQAMVDPSVVIEGIADTGKVLTFTASEAARYGYCEGICSTVDAVLKDAGIADYELEELQLTALDKIIGFLINPVVSGILIMIIIGGIYFEFQSPGAIFPILIAGFAALLYFSPLFLEGLAAHWEILLFVAGVILIAVEVFAIPGFGVAGISGIIAVVSALTLSMVGNEGFDFRPVDLTALINSFFIVISATFLAILSSIWGSRKLFTSNAFGGLALNTVQESFTGNVEVNQAKMMLIGKRGEAFTILRPAGKIKIGQDIYDAVAQTSYIEKGTPVIVVSYENAQLIVRKAD